MTSAAIWLSPMTVQELNASLRNTLDEQLGIEVTKVGPDYLTATMPVDHRTVQPFGLLHGGASVALAESTGSLAAGLAIDRRTHGVVGQEINANHVRGVRSGIVTGTARPLHIGSRSHVWDIRIVDEAEQLVCVARLTMAILERR